MGWTPLMWAANNDHLDVLLVLLKAGADTTLKDNKERTAIDIAKEPRIKRALEIRDFDLFEWLRENNLEAYATHVVKDPIVFLVLSRLQKNFLEKKKSDEVYLSNVEIQEKIGGGAFGEVYRGTWDETTTVALKKLHSIDQLEEFRAEASILRQLRHVKIVQFLGLFKKDEVEYICTEFLDRGSLDHILRREIVSQDNKIILGMDCVAGMQYLARNAIVHRDLATRNLLCKREGEYYSCKVSDFGLSRSITTESNKKSEGKELLPIKVFWGSSNLSTKCFSGQLLKLLQKRNLVHKVISIVSGLFCGRYSQMPRHPLKTFPIVKLENLF